jgi:hypothetical protein
MNTQIEKLETRTRLEGGSNNSATETTRDATDLTPRAQRKEAADGDTKLFSIKDCALVALATGKKARMLQEFRSQLAEIDAASIYHHFWGGLLLPRFEEREFNNDFAAWIRHGVHDAVLAERLAALAPTSFPDLEALRREIIELIDTRLDEMEHLIWARATDQFEFICSQIVVFDTGMTLEMPAELATTMLNLTTSSIFYHFIDARRRTSDGRDDFSDWLTGFGNEFVSLQEQLACIDPYFSSLSELREELALLFTAYFQTPSS